MGDTRMDAPAWLPWEDSRAIIGCELLYVKEDAGGQDGRVCENVGKHLCLQQRVAERGIHLEHVVIIVASIISFTNNTDVTNISKVTNITKAMKVTNITKLTKVTTLSPPMSPPSVSPTRSPALLSTLMSPPSLGPPASPPSPKPESTPNVANSTDV